MPINYQIDPSLNFLCYVATGLCAGSEFFKAEREAFQDTRRRQRMKILIDIQSAEMDIDLHDIHNLINLNKNLVREAHELEMTAVITKSKFFQTLGETVQLLANETPINLRVFTTTQDAINWLGLSEHHEEILKIRNLLKEKFKG